MTGYYHKHVVHENVVGGRSMIRFPLVIAVSERDMPGIEPGPQGWYTSAFTTGHKKWGNKLAQKFRVTSNYCPSVASNQDTDPKVAGSNPFLAASGQESCKQVST